MVHCITKVVGDYFLAVQRLLFFLVMYSLFPSKVVSSKTNVPCQTTKDSHGNLSALMDDRLKHESDLKEGGTHSLKINLLNTLFKQNKCLVRYLK